MGLSGKDRLPGAIRLGLLSAQQAFGKLDPTDRNDESVRFAKIFLFASGKTQ